MALSSEEEDVVFKVLRRNIDSTGYGYYVSDQMLHSTAHQVEAALSAYRQAKEPAAAPVTKTKSSKSDD